LLGKIRDLKTNLESAVEGEGYESQTLYPRPQEATFASVRSAAKEGLPMEEHEIL